MKTDINVITTPTSAKLIIAPVEVPPLSEWLVAEEELLKTGLLGAGISCGKELEGTTGDSVDECDDLGGDLPFSARMLSSEEGGSLCFLGEVDDEPLEDSDVGEFSGSGDDLVSDEGPEEEEATSEEELDSLELSGGALEELEEDDDDESEFPGREDELEFEDCGDGGDDELDSPEGERNELVSDEGEDESLELSLT
ncbi:hypothetical protein HPP92_026174 [Vanilla planifolia]|uniref:Uncharacterized protein n=1 Tax=Vanilla planifolia TaxID=51239 RepID=A0A835PHK4_VANPL|nr:hypothetical protein HPP92_026174 [Vanilla planifolia]